MSVYRIFAYDAVCTKHGHHTFETYVPAMDSDEAREGFTETMEFLYGCEIIDFGCYVATPIMPAKTGRKDD